MSEVLHQLAGVPGIVGTLVYGAGGEVVDSEFPAIFDTAVLREVSALLADDAVVLTQLAGESAFLDLRYRGGRVIVRPFQAGAFVVLCTTGINLQLLHLTLTQAARKLGRSPVEPPAADQKMPVVPAIPGLGPIRSKLKRAVVSQIGPIGEIVFEQVWNAWAAAGPTGKQGLAQLVDRLGAEIDEDSARRAFAGEARTIVG